MLSLPIVMRRRWWLGMLGADDDWMGKRWIARYPALLKFCIQKGFLKSNIALPKLQIQPQMTWLNSTPNIRLHKKGWLAGNRLFGTCLTKNTNMIHLLKGSCIWGPGPAILGLYRTIWPDLQPMDFDKSTLSTSPSFMEPSNISSGATTYGPRCW